MKDQSTIQFSAHGKKTSNASLTTLSRFFNISSRDLEACPIILEPFEEYSFLVQIESLTDTNKIMRAHIDYKKTEASHSHSSGERKGKVGKTAKHISHPITHREKLPQSLSSIMCTLDWQCGNYENQTVLKTTVNVGKWEIFASIPIFEYHQLGFPMTVSATKSKSSSLLSI